MSRDNIDKIAENNEDRILLAKIWDKINFGIRRNIPANTAFLSQRELNLSRFLFGQLDGLTTFGGYQNAERQMLVYLPEYLDQSYLMCDDSPICCIRAKFYENDAPSHRDFLGALLGCGIARATVGDILVNQGYCDFFTTAEIAPHVLQSLSSAGKAKLQLETIPLTSAAIPEVKFREIRDTLASVRLDNIVSSGFSISRSNAVQLIHNGKASIDGLPCEKPDKPILTGAKISVRGLGKIELHQINGTTKKGRISVLIHRFL